jgi:DNA-binding MarR family transcriptional regulator
VPDFYDPRNFDPHESLGYLIGNVRRVLLEALDRELAPHGLTAAQAIVLFQLEHGEASHAAEFCRVLQYDPGAMTRLIDRLEAKGFVRRQRAATDRRTIKVELTAAGRAAVPRMGASAIAVFNRFLRGFSKSEARQLTDLLKRLLANAADGAGK